MRVLIFFHWLFFLHPRVRLQPKEGMVALTEVGFVGIPLRGAQSPHPCDNSTWAYLTRQV